MKYRAFILKPLALAVLVGLAPTASFAASEMDELRKTVDMLQKQLEQVQEQLKAREQKSVTPAQSQTTQEAQGSRYRFGMACTEYPYPHGGLLQRRV